MGRTTRIRRRKSKQSSDSYLQQDCPVLEDLEDWMKSLDWSPTCLLTPHTFRDTGRGLKCLESIPTDQVIIKIPRNLLLTTSSVSQSQIKKIFTRTRSYKPQAVLSVLLCYEKHLGDDSKWKYYMNSLPDRYTVPDYCRNNEKLILPSFIHQDLEKQSQKVINDYRVVLESIDDLKNDGNGDCEHCGRPLGRIITFQDFKWAFYTVNTRAVYIDSSRNLNSHINVCGEDNLALAPFLDLFNHSFEASVHVELETGDDDREFYQIRTLRPFHSGSQVFINYGAHNNSKLYLEYGFFMGNNPLDEIIVDFGVIEKTFTISKNADEFIRTHGFDRSVGFSSEGLNYHAMIVLFVLSTNLRQDYWKERIYRYDFSDREVSSVNTMGAQLVNGKKMELIEELKGMKEIREQSDSFQICVSLMGEYISVCNRCLKILIS